MSDYKHEDIDDEEFSFLLSKIETSFNIQFDNEELDQVSNFGQFCDLTISKIQLSHSDDCTSQQAFYKLREALSATLHVEPRAISTDCSLATLFPPQSRQSSIMELEERLGFNFNMLRPPHWQTETLVIVLLASLLGLFFNWAIGLSGLALSIAGFYFASKNANELDLQTVGQLAEKMKREAYNRFRRNPDTFNRREIEPTLIDLLCDKLAIENGELSRDSGFRSIILPHEALYQLLCLFFSRQQAEK